MSAFAISGNAVGMRVLSAHATELVGGDWQWTENLLLAQNTLWGVFFEFGWFHMEQREPLSGLARTFAHMDMTSWPQVIAVTIAVQMALLFFEPSDLVALLNGYPLSKEVEHWRKTWERTTRLCENLPSRDLDDPLWGPTLRRPLFMASRFTCPSTHRSRVDWSGIGEPAVGLRSTSFALGDEPADPHAVSFGKELRAILRARRASAEARR